MVDSRDLIVVGAGFAGLACVKRAAERGLSVTVIDRQPSPGRRIRTTGILVKEAHAAWTAPGPLVREITRVRLYAASRRYLDLESDGYYFLATDTARLMGFLADEARRAGAEIRFGAAFRGVSEDGDRLVLDAHGISGSFLVGADGVHSAVARALGLDRNTRLLKGVEWEFEPEDRDGNCLHCFVDPQRAPGYIGWVVPGVGVTQVGLAVNQCHRVDVAGFVDSLEPIFALHGRRVHARRGGMIPVNGLLNRFHRDRVMLIGDAAGMVSPLTAGGIDSSYRYGKLAGDAIADYLQGTAPHPGNVVRSAYQSDAWKRCARWSYDHLPLAACLDLGFEAGWLLKRLAGSVFFREVARG